MKILQIIHGFGMGGAETWLVSLLEHLQGRADVQIDFLLTGGQKEIFDDMAQARGANLHYIKYGRRSLPGFVRGVGDLLRRERYDVLHDHQDIQSAYHFLICSAFATPRLKVTHVHNPAYQLRENYGVTRMRRASLWAGKFLLARQATHILGTSRQLLEEYGFYGSRFAHIPKAALYCGIATTKYAFARRDEIARSVRSELGWPEDCMIVLFVGRMDKSMAPDHPQNHKNSGFALRVVADLIRREPGFKGLFVGKPNDSERDMREFVAQMGIEDSVEFAGMRDDVPRLMAGSDVLLFPSRAEGLGLVAVEAQAAGLPVLASTMVPWEVEVVPNAVEFRDLGESVRTWADATRDLSKKKLDRSSANRAVEASRFSIERSASELIALYETGRLS